MLPPGTPITVGSHKVTIIKYLSEGGFAHVYVVKLNRKYRGMDVAVLKRVAVPDKPALVDLRIEVDTMKKLRGHKHIVTFIDSHVSTLQGGGFEVFLLMEYCAGGALIDFMNQRLQNRLVETEILGIIQDVAIGVSNMHSLTPPLVHRDLKIENVLISSSNCYKLCDFGSSASPQRPGADAGECRQIEADILRHTTPQYRAPEMVDVYRRLPIDEKSDIWALGVLLYKLCYYTTPFESQGQLAILNASFDFPPQPAFSTPLKNLIRCMLLENPVQRPDIHQVLRTISQLQNKTTVASVSICFTSTNYKSNEILSASSNPNALPVSGAVMRRGSPQPQYTPAKQILPMRRGRLPRVASSSKSVGASPDPFLLLDSVSTSNLEDTELRYPPIENFSLNLDNDPGFDFETKSEDLRGRVVEKLADEAFNAKPLENSPPFANAYPLTDSNKWSMEETAISNRAMVSRGTMTSPITTVVRSLDEMETMPLNVKGDEKSQNSSKIELCRGCARSEGSHRKGHSKEKAMTSDLSPHIHDNLSFLEQLEDRGDKHTRLQEGDAAKDRQFSEFKQTGFKNDDAEKNFFSNQSIKSEHFRSHRKKPSFLGGQSARLPLSVKLGDAFKLFEHGHHTRPHEDLSMTSLSIETEDVPVLTQQLEQRKVSSRNSENQNFLQKKNSSKSLQAKVSKLLSDFENGSSNLNGFEHSENLGNPLDDDHNETRSTSSNGQTINDTINTMRPRPPPKPRRLLSKYSLKQNQMDDEHTSFTRRFPSL